MPMELVNRLPYDHPYRWDGRAFGGPQLWRPSNLGSALALWLDAEDAASITLNGSTVSQWNDKSGNGRNVAQTTAANQPNYTASGLNGRPIVDFVRARSTWLQTGSFPTTGISAIGIATVTRWTTTGTTTNEIQILIDNNHNGNPAQGFVWQDRPDLTNKPLTAAHLPIVTNGAEDTAQTGDGTWKIISTRFISGGNDFLYVNGGAERSNSNGGTFNLQSTLRLGGGVINTRSFDGEMAELVITSADLSTTDRERLEGYLAWKWGLEANLPSGHPFKNTPPTV